MRKIIYHIIGWALLFLLILVRQRENYSELNTYTYAALQVFSMLQTLIVFYLNYFFIVPRYLKENRKILHFVFAYLALYIIGVILSFASKNLIQFLTDMDKVEIDLIHTAAGSIGPVVFFIILSTSIWFIEHNLEGKRKRTELKEAVHTAELAALKAQMNPHFLYNAFNTVYALAETKSDLTAPAILKLSDIMRYVTYQSSQIEVSIFEELEFIENYIEFQKLRTNEPEKKINVNIEKPIKDFMISPLLLISFIENAFKHSNLLRAEQQIDIRFELTLTGFLYQVSNKMSTNSITNSGIGIDTLEKILRYSYPGDYELTSEIKQDTYYATLALTLRKET